MKQQEMDKKTVFIKLHSLVSLITNSSTELFIVDISTTEGVLKDIFELIKTKGGGETRIESWENYKYKSDFLIPDNINLSNVYMCRIDQNEEFLMEIIKKYFTTIEIKYKDDE